MSAQHTLLLRNDGTVWAAGSNAFGQLGLYPQSNIGIVDFVEVVSGGAKAVAAGGKHSIVLKQNGNLTDGSVWSAGRNRFGQLGDGSNIDRHSFVQVIPSDARAVAAGKKHSLVVMRDGSVLATGFNLYGQLGDGSTKQKNEFVRVMLGGAEAVAVAAGSDHSMVLKQDGSVWTAGLNRSGQLGDGSASLKTSFVQVVSSGAKAIAAGSFHSMVLKQDGSVWATGENKYGQLGDGTTVRYSMYLVSYGARAITAGHDHSVVLNQDGSVWTTGRNNFGQLGDGTMTSSSTLMQVISSGAKTVAAGDWDSMVLKHDGSLWVTGANACGNLGVGSMIPKYKFDRALPSRDGDAVCVQCCLVVFVRVD